MCNKLVKTRANLQNIPALSIQIYTHTRVGTHYQCILLCCVEGNTTDSRVCMTLAGALDNWQTLLVVLLIICIKIR